MGAVGAPLQAARRAGGDCDGKLGPKRISLPCAGIKASRTGACVLLFECARAAITH